MFDKIIEASTFFLENFPAAQETNAYLSTRLSADSKNIFQFGYFPNSENLAALISLIGEDVLLSMNLLYYKQIHDALNPRQVPVSYFENYPLILPFKDSYGKIVAIVGRSILSEEERKAKNISKYKNTIFQKGNFLFGLYENKKSIIENNLVYLVEGQFDVIKAREHGLTNFVALGSSSMTMNQFSLILRYTNNIILLLDNDEAGEKGRLQIMSKFSNYANIQNFYLPPAFKDIDELLSNDPSALSFHT